MTGEFVHTSPKIVPVCVCKRHVSVWLSCSPRSYWIAVNITCEVVTRGVFSINGVISKNAFLVQLKGEKKNGTEGLSPEFCVSKTNMGVWDLSSHPRIFSGTTIIE